MKLRKFWPAVVSVGAVSLLVVGCGQSTQGSNSGNGAGSSAGNQTATGGSQKLTQVTFATLPIADSAAVVLAQKDGIFKKNGLDVKLKVVQTGPATTGAVVSGAAQFSQSNYATLFSAAAKGVPIKIIADAADAQPGFSYVVASPNSSIKGPSDLAGKRIATAVIGGIGPVAIDQYLKAKGIDYKSIKWVQMPFSDMGAALQRHQVDAAWVVEPFSTKLTKSAHDKIVFDVFSGPTAGWPVAAYVTNTQYLAAHPKVVAAFRKSVEEAAKIAQSDPAKIRAVLPTYTKLNASLANQIHLESYPSTMDVTKMQVIAKSMQANGFLSSSFNVSSAISSGQ